MERTPSLPKKEDSLQREEKSQFLVDLVIKIEKNRNKSLWKSQVARRNFRVLSLTD